MADKSDVQVNVRLPADLLDTLKAAAAASGRSLTAEIGKRLEESFPKTLHSLKLEQLLNTLYVTQALEFRLNRELEAEKPGSVRFDRTRARLHEVQMEIKHLQQQRNELIHKARESRAALDELGDRLRDSVSSKEPSSS